MSKMFQNFTYRGKRQKGERGKERGGCVTAVGGCTPLA